MKALFTAIRMKSPKLLIDSIYRDRESVGAKDETGQTPLHWAAVSGSTGMLLALIAAGGNPSALDHAGKTPCMLAQAAGRDDAVQILLQTESPKQFR